MKKKFRKKFFVDPTVQGAIVQRMMFHWLAVLGMLTVFLVVMQILIGGPFKPLSYHLTAIWEKYGLLLVSMACLLPVFAYDAVKLSHRFAGPMVNFRQALGRLANGENIDAVTFRKKDFWQPLTDDLNRISDELRELRPTTNTSEPETVSQNDTSEAEVSATA